MATMILATLSERRREMAILRSVGARPATILGLLVSEAALLMVVGVAAGVVLLYGALLALQPYIDRAYGLYIAIAPLKGSELITLAAIALAGVLAGLLPALRAYRLSVADGMTVRS
jgi:putative ABC transport system permease protein